MKNITLTNGETIAYREYGTGSKLILMIHGNICSGKYFESFMRYFEEDNYRIIVPDLRGFGESSYQNPIASVSDFSDDLEEILNKLGVKEFAMLGWSAGGCVCMDYSQRYPEKVQCLILVDSVGINGCPMYDENGVKYSSVQEMSKEKTQVAPALDAISRKDKDYMKTLWSNVIYIHKKPTEAEANEQAEASLKQRNLAEVYLALSDFDLTLNCHIDTPTMIVFGCDDKIVSEEENLLTAKIIKAKRFVKLPDCGHSPFMDCPDDLSKQIKAFIENEA